MLSTLRVNLNDTRERTMEEIEGDSQLTLLCDIDLSSEVNVFGGVVSESGTMLVNGSLSIILIMKLPLIRYVYHFVKSDCYY